MCFLKIPKKFILDKSYINRYGDKLLYTISELTLYEDKRGLVRFSIRCLIEGLNMKPKTGKGKINEQFKKIVDTLIEDFILLSDNNINKIDIDKIIKGNLNIPYEVNEDNEHINWFRVEEGDYLKIINSDNKLNKCKLLNIYYYILARIIKRNKEVKDINITGGYAEVFFDSQDLISKQLDISKDTLRKYIKELTKLKLIYSGNIGKITNGEIVKEANMVYSTNEDELREGLKQSKYFWEDKGWKII